MIAVNVMYLISFSLVIGWNFSMMILIYFSIFFWFRRIYKLAAESQGALAPGWIAAFLKSSLSVYLIVLTPS